MKDEARMDGTVRVEAAEGVALIVIDNPPVNASALPVREGLMAALDEVEARDDVAAAAIVGAGRTFIAGADIREFGQPPREPYLTQVCDRIEAAAKPVVAVIHGTALGGGFEVALACHARVALPGSGVGLPEVTLGVLPGAGGTQRVPRLIGIAAAVEMITTGRRIGADEAMEMGLLDRIEDGDVRDVAWRMAAEAASGALPTRKAGALSVTPDDAALKAARDRIAREQPHLVSPLKAVDAIALSTGPLDAGLAQERALFVECLSTPQRAGLIHAFFAERAVGKIPETDATPREVSRIGVVGGGTMGSGIATAALLAGYDVALAERDEDALARGRATVETNLAGAVKRGKLDAERRDRLLADGFETTTDLTDLSGADLIVEAVFEDMEVKKQVFGRLDAVAKPGAILATNTSYLDVDEIATATSRPADVLGMHFFSPAHIMRLLEVVVADATAPEVVATAFAVAKRLRKVAVRAGVCDGFIGNRILAHYRKAADYMMLDGAAPWEIDAAIRRFGFAMGPFEVSDLAGLDIGYATRKRLAATRPAAERYVPVADRVVEAGWLGRKSGRGFYDHPKGGTPVPNGDVTPFIEEARQAAGVVPRAFDAEEIAARFVTAMIAEATRVVEDGIALRPIDVDAVFLFGYGFPRFRGGPMHHADTVGAAELVRRIETWADEDPHYWQVPALLRRMAADGTTFAEMNGG